jgi:hypothetical protein
MCPLLSPPPPQTEWNSKRLTDIYVCINVCFRSYWNIPTTVGLSSACSTGDNYTNTICVLNVLCFPEFIWEGSCYIWKYIYILSHTAYIRINLSWCKFVKLNKDENIWHKFTVSIFIFRFFIWSSESWLEPWIAHWTNNGPCVWFSSCGFPPPPLT